MSTFAKTVADKVESYVALHRSLGYAVRKQASILRSLARYVQAEQLDGPLTRAMALRLSSRGKGRPTIALLAMGSSAAFASISPFMIRERKRSIRARFPGHAPFRRHAS
jgi:hypothetical protein